jgi:hypothetical protein
VFSPLELKINRPVSHNGLHPFAGAFAPHTTNPFLLLYPPTDLRDTDKQEPNGGHHPRISTILFSGPKAAGLGCPEIEGSG